MMHIVLPYLDGLLEADLAWGRFLGVLDIADAAPLPDACAALRAALAHPIGLDRPLLSAFRPGETVTIVVSDAFRYTGVECLLPGLIAALRGHGIRDEDIGFLFATGSHRPPAPDEQARILGAALYDRFQSRAVSHDPEDNASLVDIGMTSRGTPVQVHRLLRESAHVLVTGTVVLHYFGGYGGGRKSIVPGLAGTKTIAHNHALNLHPCEDRLNPAVRIGALEGNPVAEDMFEAARCCPVDGIINTVLNRDGRIAGVYVGGLDEAHQAAARHARALYAAPIARQADVVIASAGSAKDFVQSHKALFNASQAMRPGGRMVFLAPCPEGFGGNKIERWLSLRTREAIIAELRRNAEINGQTALSAVEKAPHAVMVTELSSEQTALLGAQKAESFEEALSLVRSVLAADGIEEPTFYLMPAASHTVPMYEVG